MRRAMGKKKKKLMASYKVQFVEGAIKNNMNKKQAIEIFELLEKFAEYGFVKSHSTAYAMIAFQTAWLKTYYPTEFLTANISSDINDSDRIIKLILECRRMDIKINIPDINDSNTDFKIIDDYTIQYGLSAVKNIGEKASDAIIEHREKHGPFESIFDLAKIEPSVNKKVLESLILVGACDTLHEHRSEMYESLDILLNYITKYHKAANSKQESLFGDISLASSYPSLLSVEEWTKEKCLKEEKQLLGFYLSDNPIYKYEQDLEEMMNYKYTKKDILNLSGIINDVQYRFDKNGNKWALISFDSITNNIQLYVFNDTFLKYEDIILEDQMCFILGKNFNQNDNEQISRVIVNKIYPLNQKLKYNITKYINVQLDFTIQNEDVLNQIYNLSEKYYGNYSVVLHLKSNNGSVQKILSQKIKFSIDYVCLAEIRKVVGIGNAWLSM